jgi:hypothetical protein
LSGKPGAFKGDDDMISVKSGLLRLAGSLLALQVLLAPASAGSGGEWECSTADGLYEYFDGELKARQGDEHLKAVEISRANVFDVRSTCTNKAGQSFPAWEALDVVVLRARPAGADQDYNYYVMCYAVGDGFPNNNETDTTCVKEEVQTSIVPGLKLKPDE